uniref:(northern house mosquito) hypothetical protein n=1 Tax=Culex pipiens TaxID=7175 RepID=A0A8D8L4E5_CULPI
MARSGSRTAARKSTRSTARTRSATGSRSAAATTGNHNSKTSWRSIYRVPVWTQSVTNAGTRVHHSSAELPNRKRRSTTDSTHRNWSSTTIKQQQQQPVPSLPNRRLPVSLLLCPLPLRSSSNRSSSPV